MSAFSYVTIDEADAYITAEYPADDPAREMWDLCDESDKDIRLVSACGKLDTLPFTGAATSPEQSLMWPRNGSEVVPAAIKHAQIEIALFYLRPGLRERQMRADLRAQGIKSFSLGDLSETYEDTVSGWIFLDDAKINSLLIRYIDGGYETC